MHNNANFEDLRRQAQFVISVSAWHIFRLCEAGYVLEGETNLFLQFISYLTSNVTGNTNCNLGCEYVEITIEI